MASGINSSSNPGSEDPYSTLGVERDASFDEVQKAREKRLKEIGVLTHIQKKSVLFKI